MTGTLLEPIGCDLPASCLEDARDALWVSMLLTLPTVSHNVAGVLAFGSCRGSAFPFDAALDHKLLFCKHQRAANHESRERNQQQDLLHTISPLLIKVLGRRGASI